MKKLLRSISEFILFFGFLLKGSCVASVVAENLALKRQLIIVNRKLNKAPKLKTLDRFILGWLSFFIKYSRLEKIAVIIKPATILQFHKLLVQRKYRLLFSRKSNKKPGPKGLSSEIIQLIIEIKKRNPTFGYRRIAMQISHFLQMEINKDVVRRILTKHFHKPHPSNNGPSWLTFLANQIDSLWSIDLFRAESILLKSYWIIVIMDQFTRRIVGFSVHKGNVNGIALCCMFNKIVFNKPPPKYLSSDNDPLFNFQRWQANLRILEIEEVKSMPYNPNSHPFVERLIRIIRQELLDKILFWSENDLLTKLNKFMDYYNNHRCHFGINGQVPGQIANPPTTIRKKNNNYYWLKHCNSLFELPIAA